MHSILAAQSDFSPGRSILTAKHLIAEAEKAGETVVALTDDMSVTAMIDFTNKALKANIKPIIGVRLRLVDDVAWRADKTDKKMKKGAAHYYATLYVLTEAGMKAVFRLLSRANTPENFFFVSRLSFQNLYDELATLQPGDVAMTLGDSQGVITHPNVNIVTELSRLLPGHLYASLVAIDTPYYTAINHESLKVIGDGLALPLTVRPALYEAGQADAHEIFGAIFNNNRVSDGWHRSTENRDFHVVGRAELIEETKKAAARITQRGLPPAGATFSQGLKNTATLAASATYLWKKAPVSLPVMAPDEFEELKNQCRIGWGVRFNKVVFGHQPTPLDLSTIYMPRLKYELEVLKKLSFSGYFLLVQDVVKYAKSNDILVGPGRGSVGGSLVAYLMGITDCDPIRFGLLFERFINPERIDLPDADLDFMSKRRHEVVDYLIAKYGAARVAGVSNFGTLQAASSIGGVGKAFGLPEKEYRSSKLVPKAHGMNVPLPDCAAQVPDIQAMADKWPDYWNVMTRLEGTVRNFSQHAAGVIVGGVDLVERAVIEKRTENSVVCWDKRIVEEQGLVKMDILGLTTLDLIALTLDYVRERTGARPDLNAIPLDDADVLASFAAGNTTGVFQFESGGMRRLLKELGKGGTVTFDDVTAATALYRPGPMESGMMDSFYLRKQGEEMVEYDHILMKPILEPTFGVIVYQEQVMQISVAIAGYSGADADKLRKIMGKKLPAEMRKERSKFTEGCVKTIGCLEEWAANLFDKIEGFAGYGFNKSHSVEYTLISYQAAWLKAKYPVEFFAAALSLLDEDKLPAIIRDAARFGIDVSMPDINISSNRFEIATDVRLVIPFLRIKGISHNTTDAIVAARAAGPFLNKQDFLDRVEKRKCNVRHQTVLDLVGAFSRIEVGQVPSNDPSRIRDQVELIPGLITANVPVLHDMSRDKATREAIEYVATELRNKHDPVTGDGDGVITAPYFGKNSRFMIIQDCPTNDDEKHNSLSLSKNMSAVIQAMDEHNLTRDDAYWTALVKRPKNDKQISADEIAIYEPALLEELRILTPPVIVLMGSGVVRYFLPDFKGKASELAGKVFYSKVHDANLVVGFNPGEIFYAPEKQLQMVDIFHSVLDLLP